MKNINSVLRMGLCLAIKYERNLLFGGDAVNAFWWWRECHQLGRKFLTHAVDKMAPAQIYDIFDKG